MSERSKGTPAPWRYEPATETIRSVPTNYWLASVDSWDGAVDHKANARIIATAPQGVELARMVEQHFRADVPGKHITFGIDEHNMLGLAQAILARVEGEK